VHRSKGGPFMSALGHLRLIDLPPEFAACPLRPRKRTSFQLIPAASSLRTLRGLAGLSVPARGSSAADLTTSYIPSRTPSLETDSVGKTRRAPTPGPDTVVAWHRCSCR
jgi:hypothetical protein